MDHLHLEEFTANQALWNSRVESHLKSDFYNLEAFKQGASSLNAYERDLLGDFAGKSILHLQCHFGQDTLSFAREGARATGVDFSEEAIAAAEKLRDELSLEARFECCNVYDLLLPERFDVVFTSYGTIGWLPDLKPWAEVVAKHLRAGGTFCIVDFHPVMWMLDDTYSHIHYSYFNRETIVSEQAGSYASAEGHQIPQKEYGWNHPFSEILNALLQAGLVLEQLEEWDGSPYNCFPGMVQDLDGYWRFEKLAGKIPLIYGIKMRKPV
ncbi:MAG: class I SAM-dependent methyltransferase [Bacteroidia bacterium]